MIEYSFEPSTADYSDMSYDNFMGVVEANEPPARLDSRVPTENDPAVSFAVGIGKHLKPGRVIEVDYDNLYDTMGEVGLDMTHDHSDLHIVYTDKIHGSRKPAAGVYSQPTAHYSHGTGTQEYYDIDRRNAVVEVLYTPAEKAAQNTLEHELTHHVQYLENRVDPNYSMPLDRRAAVGSIILNVIGTAATFANYSKGVYDGTHYGMTRPAVENAITLATDHYMGIGPGAGLAPFAATAGSLLYLAVSRNAHSRNKSEKEAFAASKRVKVDPVMTIKR
jgi:hypothetical protein